MSRYPTLGPGAGGATGATLDGWDLAVLDGQPMPGKSELSGAVVKLKVDRNSKPGSDGANPKLHGIDPQELSLTVTVWTDADLENLGALAAIYGPSSKPKSAKGEKPNKATPRNLSLEHPSIAHLNQPFWVVVVEVTQARVGKLGPKSREITFRLLHQLPVKAHATVTPKKAPTEDTKNVRDPGNPLPTKLPGAGNPITAPR